jgi:ubiquinone/menaquinone biosynthesis C-methylase UbiE
MNKSYLEHKNDHDYFSEDHIRNFLRNHRTGTDNLGRQKLGQIIKDAGYQCIIDAPSGSAVNFEVFKNMGVPIKEYVAFDLTTKLLEEAKRRYGKSIFTCQGYVQEIDKYFAADAMDVAICRHVFEHLPPGDMEVVIEKMLRIVKKEVILVFFNDFNMGPDHIFEERSSNIEGHPEVTHYWNTFSLPKFLKFITSFGYKIERHHVATPMAAHADNIFRIIK